MPIWAQIITWLSSGSFLSAISLFWKMRSDIKKEREDTRNKHQAELNAINDRCVNINKTVTESLNCIQKQLDTCIPELKHAQDKGIANLKLEFEKRIQGVVNEQDAKRAKDIQVVNQRIDSFETKYANDVMERLGKLEGTLNAKFGSIENTLQLVQRHFIENGGN